MIRRFSLALALLSACLLGAGASGCSTFSSNRNAASVNSHDLSVQRYQLLLEGLAQNPATFQIPPIGPEGLPGTTARGVLGQWIANAIRTDELARKGITVSAADRQSFEDQLSTGDAANLWAQLSPELQEFVLDSQVLSPVFADTFGADAQQALEQAARAARITIDSRYGMWDIETGQVVPTR